MSPQMMKKNPKLILVQMEKNVIVHHVTPLLCDRKDWGLVGARTTNVDKKGGTSLCQHNH